MDRGRTCVAYACILRCILLYAAFGQLPLRLEDISPSTELLLRHEFASQVAIALAIGIGIQNFPEGTAVAMPLRAEGLSRLRAFWYGQLSAVVEPIFAVIGAAAVVYAAPILPYALAFAAGAMIFVVAEELIPESHYAGNVDLATISLMLGFTVMMILDVALG